MGFRGRCATIVLLLFPIHHVYANTNTKSKIHAVVPPLAEPSTLNDKVIYSRNKQKILEKILGKRNHAVPNEIKEGDISALEDFLRTRGQIFHYHEQIKISSVHPSSSTTSGNVSINVFGGPFISDHHGGRIFCKFGQVAVPGSFVSSRQIHCHTPPHAPGLYSIEITQNGQDYTESGHAFRFYHQCNIFSINPVSGPSTMGGTNIQVFGENFVNSTSFLCRFGTVEVPATFVDSTKIYCSAPPIKEDNLSWLTLSDQKHIDTTLNEQQLFPSSHAYPRYSGSIVSFEVTNNGQDYTSSGFMFLYQQDIQVIKLSRIQGPSHGGTPVFISGSNFVNTTQLMCQFGKETSKAYFLTREAILCFSPPIPKHAFRSSSKEKSVLLYVTNNALDYSVGGHFTYSHVLPRGTYQPGAEGTETLLNCPRGAYCNSNLFRNFTLCYPGTYQPLVSQTQCILCPIGYICSDVGMSVPRICPAGYVCDEKGMNKAKPCPPGHWCGKGTATLSTSCLNSGILDASHSTLNTCFENSTDDFGLQASHLSAEVWSDRQLMPLDSEASIHPIRGKFCLDETCLRFDDSNDFGVVDKSFDYSSAGFALQRPHPCERGFYCHPGTATNTSSSSRHAAPLHCRDGMHCAEGSITPNGIESCKKGFYCRFGIRKPCPVGTFCSNEHVFEPMPCEPGYFNFMIGQAECSICPIGYLCPGYGSRDPVICPPGLVCSKSGLASPNIRCPAGFFCRNGTKTSDPFRNDTTLRPYACTPGSYCLAGTGSNEIRVGVVGFAQYCAPGFFCESASTSPKGSGSCPPGFTCDKGTANPRPTPKGFFAEHPGTIEATACLPGFYAPTIENKECYPCPPGTSCSVEGLFEAEECPPGTYRSTPEVDGHESCVSCPQGTWSKNWQLREKGECTRCPTGVVCPLDGMTTPCSFQDLPRPFEPIINYNGMPAFEYDFPIDAMPPSFSLDECLALNSEAEGSVAQEFFFGELIPPYIDVLGRGPNFRPSDQLSLKYQIKAKCYKNIQPDGSLLYRRMADYYGPQYDIQTGSFHQGYGTSLLLNQMYATAPPTGFDIRLKYFRGQGNGYIDLPKTRRFEPAFNCTKGFRLMNSTLFMDDVNRIVYTDPIHDFEGGYDIERCPTFDPDLKCYIDETYEVHAQGECCNVKKYEQRAILLAYDQFYAGTCEADRICMEGRSSEPEARACGDSFVCDEGASLEKSSKFPCPAGFICEFATTPDTKLHAPGSQLARLCQEGRYCNIATGTKNKVCPRNYFCPTGTACYIEGRLANDGLLRLLNEPASNPNIHLRYSDGDNFFFFSDHEMRCKAASSTSLQKRFQTQWKDPKNVEKSIEYLSEQNKLLPIVVKESTQFEETCERDNKSHFIRKAMERKDCNCYSQFFILAAVYRLWKCTSSQPLDDLGFGDAIVPNKGHGKRDFWYPASRIHKDFNSSIAMDPSLENFGLQWGHGGMCEFPTSEDMLTLTTGRIPHEGDLPYDAKGVPTESNGFIQLTNIAHAGQEVDVRFPIRFTWESKKVFANYLDLKSRVNVEYQSERDQIASGNRSDIDPFVFDLHRSIHLIEQFGEKLEQIAYLRATNKSSSLPIGIAVGQGLNTSKMFSFPRRLDWCECQNLLKCHNGTATAGEGATDISDCFSTKSEVLHRISLLPSSSVNGSTRSMSTQEGSIDDTILPLELNPFETAILTIELSMLPNNFTYGEHYRISIYDNCKPCPLRYHCERAISGARKPQTCAAPTMERQTDHLNGCLKENRKMVCLRQDGSHEDIQKCLSRQNEDGSSSSGDLLLFSEPDIEKCLSRPYFCSDAKWNYRTFRRLCQDKTETGHGEVYDCSLVHRWEVYSQWRDKVCCSEVPELRGIDSCRDNVCVDDPLIEDIIRGKMINVFELENGYVPPTEKPLGQLLMNMTLQEARDHDSPFHLFHEWQDSFTQTSHNDQKVKLHNANEPELSRSYKTTKGCCDCTRHSMPYFFENNIPPFSGFPDNKHDSIQLTISAVARVKLTIAVELVHGAFYSEFARYFGARDKSALRVHVPSRFTENAKYATWLTMLEKSVFDNLNLDLPLNLPTSVHNDGGNKLEIRFIVDRPSNISIGDHHFIKHNRGNIDEDASKYYDDGKALEASYSVKDPIETIREEDNWWKSQPDFLALPYIPFFSNCDGYDSHIGWGRLLEEHPDCLAVPSNHTEATKEYSFQSNAPISDKCIDVKLQCTYEEEITDARENLRWFETPSKSTLFYITRDAVTSDAFLSPSIAKLRNSYDIIPVSIDNEMGGFRNTIPRSIELELKYFQVSKGKKRLVEATMFFDQLCTTQAPEHFGGSTSILAIMEERGILPCEVDINGIIKSDRYDLKIQYFALGWFDLLNRFEFGGSVYFLFYTIMGLAICFIGGFVYTMNRLLTKLRHPPSFQGWSLIQLVSRPQIEGVAFALVPYMTVILTIHSCFGNDPIFNFDSIHKNWLSSGVIHDKDKIENAMGRMGSALLVLGFYLTCKGSRSIIPILEGKTENDASENKHAIAKRAHFIWASICLQAVMLCIWEFSYSDTYKNDIYRFVVIFKVSHILFDVIISQVIKDKLLVAPLLVTIQMTEILVTIGARDFVEFTLSFLVEVSLVVFQRLFLYPLIKTMSTLWPRWKMLASQTFGRKGITRQEKKELEFRWKKVNEDIELQSEGVEPLLHSISIYSIEKTGGILVPFLLLFLMLIYRETEVAMNYNINQHELLYYGTFAFYMILWMCFVDAFVLSSQELIYGWRVYDYFSYQRWRFANRESRWNLLSQVDESLTQSLQTLDLLCFSSQYYFILTLLTLGFCTNMFAITICLRRKYNFLADPVFPFVVVAVVLCCEAASMICVYISNTSMDTVCWRGVWKISQLQGTMDDVIAAKLAIGEGRQEDLEQERQELQALNSEAFRHKFIEKNRPWVLQHLVELVTPRSLQDTGPDGRPLADYIRDVYSNLMNIGEVTKRAGDRSDISSDDSSDDDFEKRRLWDRTPLEGNRLLIAQIWLQKARKRGVFAKAVSSIIQKRREDHCSVCSRTLSSCTSLTAGLASDGNFDIYAIDCLIRQFEDHYSSQESDPTLWKAFFRENAKFMTVCNICLDQVEQHKLHKNIRHVGAGLPTRPGDISSDDESEDDIFYDPVVVVRSSNDGKMMNKWLWAARHKLGGEFPRRGAAKQTEKYLRRLKTRTIDRTKHVGRPKSCDGSKVNTQEDWGMLSLGDPGKMIMARWLSDARKTTRTRFNRQAEDCI